MNEKMPDAVKRMLLTAHLPLCGLFLHGVELDAPWYRRIRLSDWTKAEWTTTKGAVAFDMVRLYDDRDLLVWERTFPVESLHFSHDGDTLTVSMPIYLE